MRMNSLTITLPCAHDHGNDSPNSLVSKPRAGLVPEKRAQCQQNLHNKVSMLAFPGATQTRDFHLL